MKPFRMLVTTGLLFLVCIGYILQQPARGFATSGDSSASVTPVGQTASDWMLTFNDEFNSAALDRATWRSEYTNGGHGELQQYVNNDSRANYLEQNGVLSLVARQENFAGMAYTSGVITTQDRFFQKYGFFEIRARVPAGTGFWPAFWLLPNPNGKVPEIDVMENVGNDVHTVNMTLHYLDKSGALSESTDYFTGPDFSSGWHTFGVDWKPNSLTWYVDGIARKQILDPTTIPAVPMFVIANLAVGGKWPGSPNATTAFPASYAIDYIRVWQKAGLVTPPPPPTNNLVKNPSFDDPTVYPWDYPWNYRNNLGATFQQDTADTANHSKASLKATLPGGNSTQPWVVSAMQYDKSLTAGQSYVLSFWAKASTNRPIHTYIQEKSAPYTVYFMQPSDLSNGWRKFSYTFVASATTTTAVLNFNLADAGGTVWLDEVSLCQGNVDCTSSAGRSLTKTTFMPAMIR